MNKARSMKRKAIDSSVAGSSKSQNIDESERNSSVRTNNSKSSTRKRAKTAVDPSEETTTKKRKIDSNVAGPSKQNVNEKMELDSSVQKKTKSVDDLPPEMLRAVLNHFATDDLLNCRRVNHKWNELTSQILHYRADKMLRFRCEGGHFKRNIRVHRCDLMGCTCTDWYECNTNSLTDLLNCFKDCKLQPYTSFDFGDLAHFENEDMKRFLTIWGKHVISLKIQMVDPVKSVQTLKKLLLEQIPNLKKLEIRIDYHYVSSVKVLTPNQQAFPLFQKFQLPKLEVLVVDTHYIQLLGIIENILTAACNLNEFVYNNMSDSITKEDLIMLQSLNKLKCLQAVEIKLSEDLITYWTKSSKNLDLKLRTLNLSFGEIWGDQQLKSNATSVVNQLLESSKDVIVTLRMEAIGLLPGVIFPKLEKLRVLDLVQRPSRYSEATKRTMFPQPFEMTDVFPNLEELEMHVACTDDYFPQPLAPMQSIEVLRIYVDSSIGDKERLMKMTPNVKSLLLVGNSPFSENREKGRFVKGFQVIVNNLKKLETFGWVIGQMTHRQLLYKLDAAMTGLTEEFCEKLSVKFRNKHKLSAKELTSIEPRRKHSSILDLKDLRKMDVTLQFDMDCYACMDEDGGECGSDCEESDCEGECGGFPDKEDEAGYDRSSDFHNTGFTKVSEFLAFKLMPNLKIRTHIVMD